MQQFNPNPANFYYPPPPLLPAAPNDIELKNIIDKLANFVARNGFEFENVTKTKQKDNPKFKFLFGGEFSNYYSYKLNIERELLKYQQIQTSTQSSQNFQSVPPLMSQQVNTQVPPPQLMSLGVQSYPFSCSSDFGSQIAFPTTTTNDSPIMVQVFNLQQKINNFLEQIQQSEKNLSAQKESFSVNKKISIAESVQLKRTEHMQKLISDSKLDLNTFDYMINRIVQTCSKDAISTGRNFVIGKHLNHKFMEAVCSYLMHRILYKEKSSEAIIHLFYFINDLIENGNKQNNDIVKKHLESIIVTVFTSAFERVEEEKKPKMNKLIEIWNKNCSFEAATIDKLRNHSLGSKYAEETVKEEFKQVIDEIEADFERQYNQLRKQHFEYLNHSNEQINILQNQINQLLKQQQTQTLMSTPPPPLMGSLPNTPQAAKMTLPDLNVPPPPLPNLSVPPPSLMATASNPKFASGSPQISSPVVKNSNQPLPSLMSLNPFNQDAVATLQPTAQPTQTSKLPVTPLMSIPSPKLSNNPASNAPPSNIILPMPVVMSNTLDLTKPPPLDVDIPFYNLPASLMVPLIKSEDCEYWPLDPKLIKMPPPIVPSDKLLKAVDEFYNIKDKKINEDGWEEMGLFEFYKSKLKHVFEKEATRKKVKTKTNSKKKRSRRSSRSRSRSRSRSNSRRRNLRKRSYSSRSRSSSSRSRSSSSDESKSRSRSRSYSRSSTRSRTRSRSRTRTRSKSPVNRRQNNMRLPNAMNKRRSRSRSATPPHQISSFTAASSFMEQKLDNSNKGHKLLQKMGWSGNKGLGKNEQGIFNPIEGGDVRDKSDQYRGIGSKSDPFEMFRKNKSQGYIQRMRERDEERETQRKSFGTNAKDSQQ